MGGVGQKVWGENFTDYFSKQPNAVKPSLLTCHWGHFEGKMCECLWAQNEDISFTHLWQGTRRGQLYSQA